MIVHLVYSNCFYCCLLSFLTFVLLNLHYQTTMGKASLERYTELIGETIARVLLETII